MKRATVAKLADAAGLKPVGNTLSLAGSKPAGRTKAVPSLYATVSEQDFQRQVVAAANLLGWAVYHTWNSQHSPDGYPDLTLAKAEHPVIFAELKSESGQLQSAQIHWLDTLKQCPGVEVYLWRPSDIDTIITLLGDQA